MTTLNRPRNYFSSLDTPLKSSKARPTTRQHPSPPRALKAPSLQAQNTPSNSSRAQRESTPDPDLIIYGSTKKVKRETNSLAIVTASSSKDSNPEDNQTPRRFSLRNTHKSGTHLTVETPKSLADKLQKKGNSSQPGKSASPSKKKGNISDQSKDDKDDLSMTEDSKPDRTPGSPSGNPNKAGSGPFRDTTILDAFKVSGPSGRRENRGHKMFTSGMYAKNLEFSSQRSDSSKQLQPVKPKGLKQSLKDTIKTKGREGMKIEKIGSDRSKEVETIVIDREPMMICSPSMRSSSGAFDIPEVIDLESISVAKDSIDEPELIIDPIDPRIIVSISPQTLGFFHKIELREKAGLRADIKRINGLNLKRVFKEYRPDKLKEQALKKQDNLYDMNNPKFSEVRVGKAFQANVPALGDKNKPRIVKSVWKPDSVKRRLLEKYFEGLDKESPFEITNEVAKINLLKDFDLNTEKALEHIVRNKLVYRLFFRTERRRGQKTVQ